MYRQSLENDPENLAVLKTMEDIYNARGQMIELVTTFQQELAVSGLDPERRIALWLKAGEIQEFHLDNCDGAKKSYLDVLEIDPRNLIAIRGLERIYQANKEYNALQSMLLKELQVQESWERELAIYREIALLKEEKFGEIEGAIEYFGKVHQQCPDDLFIIDRLKKLWHQQTRMAALCRDRRKRNCLALPGRTSSRVTPGVATNLRRTSRSTPNQRLPTAK